MINIYHKSINGAVLLIWMMSSSTPCEWGQAHSTKAGINVSTSSRLCSATLIRKLSAERVAIARILIVHYYVFMWIKMFQHYLPICGPTHTVSVKLSVCRSTVSTRVTTVKIPVTCSQETYLGLFRLLIFNTTR